MKQTQKLIVTIEDVEYLTTYGALDTKIKPIADKLEEEEFPQFGVTSVHLAAGNAALCVKVMYMGKAPAKTKKIFGYDADVLMAMQCKSEN